MKRRSFLSALLWTCWIPFVIMGVSVGFHALRVTGKKTEFYALGKIVAGHVFAGLTASVGFSSGEVGVESGFYQTQIDILESGALRLRALERVRATHPDRKEIDVEVRVTRSKGSAIMNIVAIGEEPTYTRLFLDALLDEYIAFRKEMMDKSIATQMHKVIEEVLVHERRFKEAKSALDQFDRANDSLLLSAEHERRVKEVSSLRGELEELKRSAPDDSKMKALMAHLDEADKARADMWEKTSAELVIRKDFEDAEKSYNEWRKVMERLDNTSKFMDEMVAIMERPNAAVVQEPDVMGSLFTWGAKGLSVGVVLMLLAAMAIAGLGGKTPDAQPPPLS